MKTARSHGVIFGMLAAAFAAGSGAAQAFPSKVVRLVVPFPPGGSSDAVARAMSEPLSRVFAQSVVVVNRPGANMMQHLSAELLKLRAGINLKHVAFQGRRHRPWPCWADMSAS